ncbi:lipase family protein [Streptomyces cavernicola]|uniref:Lipase family protein n=1 Tax=Streptomyces cavernicola TaxID=3043613 RepID=A0ABT6SCG3_9ACTN|nr:lipase family protein [Streptomyces sp. B-S-A6]MDI3405158.1 lipase family protein [Streptomyces sp. B-S-A6]
MTSALRRRPLATGAVLAVAVLGIPGAAAAQGTAEAPDATPRSTTTPTEAKAATKAEAQAAAKKAKSKGKKKAAPGEILTSEPSSFQYTPGVPTPTKAWKITYRSTSADGQANAVSGTVIVPDDGKTTPRPLITYAVGTVGIGDKCAPSAGFPGGTTAEAPLVNAALVRGYAVVVTDYEGLGTPGDHTYMVEAAQGSAVLDAARAAQRHSDAAKFGVSPEAPVGIMGYSQGGGASAKAAEMAATYAPELKVKGTASGGVPADLAKVAESLEGGDSAGYLLMSAVGQNAAKPSLNLDSYLNDEGRELTEVVRNECVGTVLEAGRGKAIEDVTTSNPLDRPEWQQAIGEQLIGTVRPSAPVFLYHGDADETIPYAVGQKLRADWCGQGHAVEWKTFPGQSHVGTAIQGNGPALEWLGQRFADQPTTGNCGT